MKKLIVMALIVAISSVSFGQSAGELTIKGSKMITRETTPQQVIDTMKKRFPNAEAVQYYQTSAAAANGWAVSAEDQIQSGAEVDYYTLKFKRTDFQYYGLFKADGTLVKSEFQQKDVELPEAVKASLLKLKADKYPDYLLSTKDYFKYEDYDKQKAYYVITAMKISDSTQKKTVVVDPAGNIIKEK